MKRIIGLSLLLLSFPVSSSGFIFYQDTVYETNFGREYAQRDTFFKNNSTQSLKIDSIDIIDLKVPFKLLGHYDLYTEMDGGFGTSYFRIRDNGITGTWDLSHLFQPGDVIFLGNVYIDWCAPCIIEPGPNTTVPNDTIKVKLIFFTSDGTSDSVVFIGRRDQEPGTSAISNKPSAFKKCPSGKHVIRRMYDALGRSMPKSDFNQKKLIKNDKVIIFK